MIRFLFCLTIASLASILPAADSSDKPMTAADRAELEATVYPYEPWTKTARVGDFIVRKYTAGPVVRTTIRSIDADFIHVDEITDLKGKRTELHRKYSRAENTMKTRELEMKSDGAFEQRVNSVTLKCEAFDGSLVTARKEWNGELLAMKLTHFRKVIAEDVPFGGVIRELQAPDDKVPLAAKPGTFVRLKNTIDMLQVTMEVTDWGNVGEEKKK